MNLRTVFSAGILSIAFWAQCIAQQVITPADCVNPFIDTHKSRWFYFSSASRPFGMVNLSPDTQTNGSWNSGYMYDSLHVSCFSHIHAWQMSGVAVMPATGEFKGHLGMNAYRSAFSHKGEIAKPGYHRIFLDDYNVLCELTSTTRAGFHQYTFPESKSSYVMFDVGAFLGHGPKAHAEAWKVNATEIAGYEIMALDGYKDTGMSVRSRLECANSRRRVCSSPSTARSPSCAARQTTASSPSTAIRT